MSAPSAPAAPPPAPAPAAARRARSADTRPGWYPDPDGDDGLYRWWTGESWTAWLTDRPDAPPPPYGRREWGPRASETVTPRTSRFGAASRVLMGLVVLAVLVGAMIAFGWQRRDERPLTFDPPTASYQPADLSVVCENTRMTIGGALTVDISDEFSVAGPKVMQPLNQLQCRGLLPDETGGNALLALGIAPAEEAARSVREEAETAYRTVVAGLYVGGAAEESEVVGGAADGFGDAWRITAVLVGPKKTGRDHVELIVVDLGAGRRAVWLQLVGEGVSPDTRAIFDAARKSLRRV